MFSYSFSRAEGAMSSGGAVLVEPVPMKEPRNWGVLGHLTEEQTKSMRVFIESSKHFARIAHSCMH